MTRLAPSALLVRLAASELAGHPDSATRGESDAARGVGNGGVVVDTLGGGETVGGAGRCRVVGAGDAPGGAVVAAGRGDVPVAAVGVGEAVVPAGGGDTVLAVPDDGVNGAGDGLLVGAPRGCLRAAAGGGGGVAVAERRFG